MKYTKCRTTQYIKTNKVSSIVHIISLEKSWKQNERLQNYIPVNFLDNSFGVGMLTRKSEVEHCSTKSRK